MNKIDSKYLGCFQFKAKTNMGTSARYRVIIYEGGIIVHKFFMCRNDEKLDISLRILRMGKTYIYYLHTSSFKIESLATIMIGIKEVYESQGIKPHEIKSI